MSNGSNGKKNIVQKHKELLAAMNGYTVEAGWFASARYQAKEDIDPKMVGVPVANVARIHEFGATVIFNGRRMQIPARAPMRLATQKFRAARQDVQKKVLRQIMRGKIEPIQGLGQIGLVMENCIVESIHAGGANPVPNSKFTQDLKGFNKPLIDTGQMWQAVTSKVVKST